jgi:hypothetical protein
VKKHKLLIMTFFLLLLLGGIFGTAHAEAAGWERSLHVEWGYTPPSDLTISEFRLYQDATKVCTWTGAATRSGDCKVTLQKSTTAFTLEAAFTNNTASPRSAPFNFSDFGSGPSILILIGK